MLLLVSFICLVLFGMVFRGFCSLLHPQRQRIFSMAFGGLDFLISKACAAFGVHNLLVWNPKKAQTTELTGFLL